MPPIPVLNACSGHVQLIVSFEAPGFGRSTPDVQ